MSGPRRFQIFVYGTFLPEEPDHGLLEGAKALGPAKTKPIYHLVELQTSAALLAGGRSAVIGELFEVDVHILAKCDVLRQHPVLYKRQRVELEGAQEAWAYFLGVEQTRGRRRIRDGDWKGRFKPKKKAEAGPFVSWSRSRYKR